MGTEERQVTRWVQRRVRSLGGNREGPGHLVGVEEGQVSRWGYRRARLLGGDIVRPGH